MTEKPVWLLDVDGVINACPYDGQFPSTYPIETWSLIYGTAQGKQWPIRYSSSLIERINELSEHAEIRWHTTWTEDAPALGAQLGLKEFKVADTSGYYQQKFSGYVNYSNYNWWKFQAAEDVLRNEGRHLVWTDDDLGSEWQHLIADIARECELNVICVQPQTYCGLREAELNEVEKFISKIEAKASDAA